MLRNVPPFKVVVIFHYPGGDVIGVLLDDATIMC